VILAATDLIPFIHPTPIVEMIKSRVKGSLLYAKLEFLNPYSQSIKDRAAIFMIRETLKKRPSKIYEASSGNFAIALTLLSNAYGIPVRIYLPKNAPESTKKLLRLLGAQVIKTDFESITPEMVEIVKREAEKDGAINLNQFESELNPLAHYLGTGEELVKQLREGGVKPTHIVLTIGTTGTLWGIAKRVREVEEWEGTKLIGVQPAVGSKIPGIKRIESRPKWLKLANPDLIIDVTEEEAAQGVIEIARKEGLAVGMSSGAAYVAYKKIAETEEGVFVTVFPDSIYKYIEMIEKLVEV